MTSRQQPRSCPLGDGLWEADARAELDEVASEIDPRLAEVEEDVDTLGGLASVLAGHVPQPGEIVTHGSGWRLEVTEGDARRVTRGCAPPRPRRNRVGRGIVWCSAGGMAAGENARCVCRSLRPRSP